MVEASLREHKMIPRYPAVDAQLVCLPCLSSKRMVRPQSLLEEDAYQSSSVKAGLLRVFVLALAKSIYPFE